MRNKAVTSRVTFADRAASALVAAIAGGVTGTLVWALFALWLGRYFLSVTDLHFLDTVTAFSVIPASIGFLAPALAPNIFGFLWKGMWKILREGPPPA